MDFARKRFALMRIRAAILGLVMFGALLPMEVRQAVSQESAPAASLAGEYKNTADPDSFLTFYVEGGKLKVESDRWVPAELKAVSPTEFEFTAEKAKFHFASDANGETVTVSNAES